MGATSLEKAHKVVTASHKVRYGRAFRLYKLIPVALPRRIAEDFIKRGPRRHHVCGELYDLPRDETEFHRVLDSVFDALENSIENAYSVERSADARTLQLRAKRSALLEREEERLNRKQRRLEELEEKAICEYEAREAADAKKAWHTLYTALARS